MLHTILPPLLTLPHTRTLPSYIQVGGMVLHEGQIAEMATGEGKTLVATLPVYLNALRRRVRPPALCPPRPPPHTFTRARCSLPCCRSTSTRR